MYESGVAVQIIFVPVTVYLPLVAFDRDGPNW